ncbi:hypothetical protein T484DRAFT_1768116 [Baffinella frigidus]|nr:hypothetical protein T484DRAFT_1768116 [Cryptophyta sp. CCMP2293]
MPTNLTVLAFLAFQCASVCALGGWGDVFLSPVSRCAKAEWVTGGELEGILKRSCGSGVAAMRGGGDVEELGLRQPGSGAVENPMRVQILQHAMLHSDSGSFVFYGRNAEVGGRSSTDSVAHVLSRFMRGGSTHFPEGCAFGSRREYVSGQMDSPEPAEKKAARQATFRSQLAVQIHVLTGKEPRWELQTNGDYAIHEESFLRVIKKNKKTKKKKEKKKNKKNKNKNKNKEGEKKKKQKKKKKQQQRACEFSPGMSQRMYGTGE